MKILLFTLTSLMITHQAATASPEVLGKMIDVKSTIMNATKTLLCKRVDTDQDGIADSAKITLFGNQMGFLRKRLVISNTVTDPENTICDDVAVIVDRSFQNFTAIDITTNSILYMDRGGNILESMLLKITNISQPADDPSPVITLQKVVSIPLNQQGGHQQ